MACIFPLVHAINTLCLPYNESQQKKGQNLKVEKVGGETKSTYIYIIPVKHCKFRPTNCVADPNLIGSSESCQLNLTFQALVY
jgi:hypothetical protein